MSAHDASNEELFQAPPRKPKLKMWHYQWIGIPIIILIPVMALLGVFGEQTTKVQLSGEGLEASLEYPQKLRFGQDEFIRLEVSNTTSRALTNVTISFDKSYIEKFAEKSFTPEVQANYEMKNVEIPANETKTFEVRVKAGDSGSHSGEIKIRKEDEDILSHEISTFVFP